MIQIGMLWLDEAPGRALSARVVEAAAYYRRKYGRAPTVCYVHPSMLSTEGEFEIDGVEVRPLADILPHHLWLGVGEAALHAENLQTPTVFKPH